MSKNHVFETQMNKMQTVSRKMKTSMEDNINEDIQNITVNQK